MEKYVCFFLIMVSLLMHSSGVFSQDFIMDHSASYTTCGGSFYDSGGSGLSYMHAQNDTVVFIPENPASDKLSATFTYFNVYPGDTLYAYDGNGTRADKLVGKYTGRIGPGTITSTAVDGSLTFRFVSDGTVTTDGWRATLFCTEAVPVNSISGIIWDVNFHSSTAALVQTPLEGASVWLLEGQNVVASTQSDADGLFEFSGLSPGTYVLKAVYIDEADTFEMQISNPALGTSHEMVLPVLLSRTIKGQMRLLNPLNLNIAELSERYQIEGYDLTMLEAILADVRSIEEDYEGVIETLGRILVMELALNRYYAGANLLLEERQLARHDLIIMIASLANTYEGINALTERRVWGTAPLDRVTKKIILHLFGVIGKSLRGLMYLMNSAFTGPEGQETRAGIEQAVTYLSLVIEGQHVETLVRAAANEYIIRRPVLNQIQRKYLLPTQEAFDMNLINAMTYPVESGFTNAYQRMLNEYAIADEKMVRSIEGTTFGREFGEFGNKAFELMELAEDIAGLGDLKNMPFSYWKKIKLVINAARFSALIGANIESTRGFRRHRLAAASSVRTSFLRSAQPGPLKEYPVNQLMSYRRATDSCMQAYIANLRELSTQIDRNEPNLIAEAIETQIYLDSCVAKSLEASLIPIMAANEILADSIQDYDSLFFKQMTDPLIAMEMQRIQTFNLSVQFLLDSVQAPYADSIRFLADSLEHSWGILSNRIDSTYQQIRQVPSPAYIIPVADNLPDSLQPGETYTVFIAYKNAGAVESHQLQASVMTQDGLLVDQTLIPLSDVAPGFVDTLFFQITAPELDTLVGYQVHFSGLNVAALGIGGAILVTSPSTTHLPQNDDVKFVKVFPNPFTSTTTIQFETKTPGLMQLSVYTMDGRQVAQQFQRVGRAGLRSWIFDGAQLPSGIYYFRLATPAQPYYGKMSILPQK